VSRLLGVSKATVYKLCVSGALHHVRVSNAIRVPAASLVAFFAGGRKQVVPVSDPSARTGTNSDPRTGDTR
jgi:excisionase family DNA binding protein